MTPANSQRLANLHKPGGAVADGRGSIQAGVLPLTPLTGRPLSPPPQVYPVVVHASWSSSSYLGMFRTNGKLLFDTGSIDYAGSGVVHMTGGVAAAVGCAILGPRLGRFRADGTVRLHSPHLFLPTWPLCSRILRSTAQGMIGGAEAPSGDMLRSVFCWR